MPNAMIFEEDSEMYTKALATTMETEKLDEDKTPKDAKRDDLEEGPEMYTKAPAATMKTEKLDEDTKKTKYVNGGYFEEGDPVSSTK